MRFAHEAHVPAVGRTAKAHPWLPGPHAHALWRRGHPRTPGEGPNPAQRLTLTVRPHSLPKAARLRQPGEFRAVFESRRSFAGRYFQVFARRNGLGMARLGLVVSRKVAPRAVDRNYAKRIAREVFRQRRASLGAEDIVVRLKRAIPRAEGIAAQQELAALMERIAPCRASSSG